MIRWAPIIWSNYDFDHDYLFEVIRFKLLMMVCLFEDSNWAVCADAHRRADEMRHAVEMIDRILADEYDEEALMPHEAKWGKMRVYIEDLVLSDTEDEPGARVIFKRDNVRGDREEEQEREEYLEVMREAANARDKEIHDLFGFIADHILDWWD